MSKLPIAAQLYTLRDLTRTDFAGTLAQVRNIGYRGVELAGHGNLASAKDVRKVLDDLDLELAGAHIGIDTLEKDLAQTLDEQAVLGNQNIVCPYLPDNRRKDAEGWRQVAHSLSTIASKCKQRGLNFAYHNHSFEFQPVETEGKQTTGMDILWQNTEANLVRAELDVYWVQHANLDPVQYIKTLNKRVLLLHLKDLAKDEEKSFAPVGEGILNFQEIIAAGESVGAQWGIVEQDSTYKVPPLDALRISYDNLRKLGAV